MTVWAPMQHCAYVFLSLNSRIHAKVFRTSGVFWMLYLTQTAYISVWKWLISLNSQAGRAALKLGYLYATESPLETFIVVLARAWQFFKTFLITLQVSVSFYKAWRITRQYFSCRTDWMTPCLLVILSVYGNKQDMVFYCLITSELQKPYFCPSFGMC